jgi:hypothetical protein
VEALPSCHHGFGFGFGSVVGCLADLADYFGFGFGPVVGCLADLADYFGSGMTYQKSVGFPD